MMRFHVINLPHTNTTAEFQSCAYTEKVRKFCRMMMDRGHHVTLYGGEYNEAPCSEHVVLVTDEERAAFVGDRHYTAAFDEGSAYFASFNRMAVAAITPRIQPHDFICIIGGTAQKAIADAFPKNMAVEFGIGYGGTFANYKVWESYAWMHTCYGAASQGHPMSVDGQWYDAVIPGYLEADRFFKTADRKGDYILFLGRMVDRKGIHVASQACNAAGVRLVMAGIGTPPDGVDYIGELGHESKVEAMRHARALICPTIYVEPFGNVAIEAMACGTPVISTDWGAFTETVRQGITGYRCRTLQEFVDAIDNLDKLAPSDYIREYAISNYGLSAIGERYEQYFERLLALWGKGWYELSPRPAPAPIVERVYRQAADA